jgi:predicted RNA methylase
MVGTIFLKAQNEIQDPAKLKRIVGLIDGERWLEHGVDVKGSIYEGLLERNAQEVKSGAGQYFTPRALIKAMVTVVDPNPRETIHDPACGTGGFLLAAWEHMCNKPLARNAEIYQDMRSRFSGVDIVPEVVRLCAMNLYLHDIAGSASPIEQRDALLGAGGKIFNVVLTNPPFGKKQSYRIVRDDGEIDTEREDYDRQDLPGLFRHHFQQAAQFSPAHHDGAGRGWPRRRGAARQRVIRGRRGRDDTPAPPQEFRLSYPAAVADRHFLQTGRQGQCVILRQEAGVGKGELQGTVDLRPAHQPALHPQGAADGARRPR